MPDSGDEKGGWHGQSAVGAAAEVRCKCQGETGPAFTVLRLQGEDSKQVPSAGGCALKTGTG